MGASVFALTLFITRYLPENKTFGRILSIVGAIVFLSSITLIIVNIFQPIFFRFDEDNVYHAMAGRYAYFTAQMVMFFLSMIASFMTALKTKGSLRYRYLATAALSGALIAGIVFQVLYPLAPFYAIGALIGIAIMHVFVLTGEKAESLAELQKAKELNNRDPLTGLGSRYAYVRQEEKMDQLISKGAVDRFAVIVFDLNNLKDVNDKKGHETGDRYIIRSARLIQEHFGEAELFRFGGDEFVAILKGDVYEKREALLAGFDHAILENIPNGDPVIATGISEYNVKMDNTFRAVFIRADAAMYKKKAQLKGARAS
jgi:diguanylate cyclase (GGDEF)-like protein